MLNAQEDVITDVRMSIEIMTYVLQMSKLQRKGKAFPHCAAAEPRARCAAIERSLPSAVATGGRCSTAQSFGAGDPASVTHTV